MVSQAAGSPSRYRVLVVDDDDWMRKTIQSVLGAEMDVVGCTSGESALRLLATEEFHVVCTDYKMPGISGIELLQRVSQIDENIGCLLVTGADEHFQSEERKNYYALLKPFDPKRLLNVVKQLARVAEMKRSVSAGGPRASAPPPPPSGPMSERAPQSTRPGPGPGPISQVPPPSTRWRPR
jgi:DNA-binding NtrC family response regulator